MKFKKQIVNIYSVHRGIKDIPVEAHCLPRVCVHKDIYDRSQTHYAVSLIGCGCRVISTCSMHERKQAGNLKRAKALAIAIETQIKSGIETEDPTALSKETLRQLAILVGQFRASHEFNVNEDTTGVLGLMPALV